MSGHLSFALRQQHDTFTLRAEGCIPLQGVTALFGPSGSGKSTVLRAIAGLLPQAGEVHYDTECWQSAALSVPAHKRHVGFVMQEPALFPHLSVMGNLRYAERRRRKSAERPPSVDTVATVLELNDLLHRSVAALSGGEARRVAIARALMSAPRILLLDEPLSGLDVRRKSVIIAMIRELAEKFAIPVVFVSHVVEEIVQVADFLIALHDGEVVASGALSEQMALLEDAVTGHFEAGALLEGRVTEYDARFAVARVSLDQGADTEALFLWVPAPSPMQTGTRVRLRIRARDVAIALEPVSGVSVRNQPKATVVHVEVEAGPFAELVLQIGSQRIRSRITRLALDELKVQPGQSVHALVKSVAFDRRLG